METYILFVGCYKGTSFTDGGEQARGQYADDQAAIGALLPKINVLLRHYDRIEVQIKAGSGREVYRS